MSLAHLAVAVQVQKTCFSVLKRLVEAWSELITVRVTGSILLSN